MKKLLALIGVLLLAFCVLGAGSSPLNDGFFPSYVDGVANPAFVDSTPGYFLKDEFITPRAAGSVNSTAAEPGPGARTVVDTASKLSLSGDKLVFAGGKASPAHGDPGLWLTAQTRVPGLLGIVSPTFVATNTYGTYGFGSSQSGQPGEAGFYCNNAGNIVPVTNTGTIIASYTATTYKFAFAVGSTGWFGFIKGGAFTNWTLIHKDELQNYSTLYIGAANYNSASSVDYIRIPTSRWLPSPLAYDTFANTFGTTTGYAGDGGYGVGGSGLTWTGATWATSGGSAYNAPTAGTEKVSDTGFAAAGDWTDSGASFPVAAGVATGTLTSDTLTNTAGTAATVGLWYTMTATFTVTAGSVQMGMGGGVGLAISASGTYTQNARATTTGPPLLVGTGFTGTVDNFSVKPLTFAEMFASHTATTNDVLIDVDWTIPNGTQAGLRMNCDSQTNPQNFIQAHYTRSTGKVMLLKYLNGAYAADLLNVTASYSAGAVLRVRKIGLVYYVWYNNVLIGTWTANATTDANILSNTLHGPFSTNSTATLNNYKEYAVGSHGEYAIMDMF